MAQSPEVQALTALVAVLTTGLAELPPGDWMYERPPNVRRAPVPPPGQQMKADECPVVYVVPGQGSQLDAMAQHGGIKKLAYTHRFNVDLWGFVWREAIDDVLADDERFNLRSHVADLVVAHRHLGGLSRDGIVLGGRPEAVDTGELAPAAYFVLPLTIPIAQSFSTVPA